MIRSIDEARIQKTSNGLAWTEGRSCCQKIEENHWSDDGKYDYRLNSIRARSISLERLEPSTFADLPNEIYREIFDYLSAFDILQSFDGLNQRLNAVLGDVPMKLRFDHLNKTAYQRVLKQIVPKVIQQTVALDLGQSSKIQYGYRSSIEPENLIDLFTQSFDFSLFVNLRCLSLTSPRLHQLEAVLRILPRLETLRSFRLLEQNYYGSHQENVCRLTLANNRYCPLSSHQRLTHVSIEVSPRFKTIALLQQYLTNQVSLKHLDVTIRCAPFFYPDVLRHLPYDVLARLVPQMNYCRLDIATGPATAVFDLIRCFPQISHLSVSTVWQAYANGCQWAELLAQMPSLVDLDLDLQLDPSSSERELQTFQTKFWFDRRWLIQYRKSISPSVPCRFVHRTSSSR